MRGSRLEDKSNLLLDLHGEHNRATSPFYLIEEAPREFSIVPAEGKIGLLTPLSGPNFLSCFLFLG